MPALTVPTIFTAVDKLSSVVSKMQGNVGKFATDTQKKYAQMNRSAQAWSTNSRQVALSAGIMGAAIIAPLALSVKKAMEFEDQMANVGTIVDTTKESLTSMGNQVLSVFTKVPVKLDDLTEALYKIRSAGIPAAEAMDVLNSAAKLGVAGRGTTVEATQMLTGAMKVFASEGLNANQIAGLLFETVRKGNTKISDMSEAFGATAPIIAAGGVKLKDFSAMVSAMTSVSTPAAQVMNEIRASVIAMEKPSTRMAFLFHNLGIKNLQEGITKFGNLGGVMQAVEDKAKSMGVNINKAIGKVNAMTAFTLLTSISKADYTKNASSMNTSDADFAAAYALKLQTLKAQSQLLSNELQYFAIKAGTVLIPILVKLAKELQPTIEAFGKWIDRNPGLAGAIIKTTAAVGAFLLVLSPIALVVGGISDAVRVYSGIQLALAAKTAVATAATEAQAVAFATDADAAYEAAYAAKALGSTSLLALSGQLVAIGGLAYEIDRHWKEWGNSITALLGPFGEVFNMIEQIKGGANTAFAADMKKGGVGGFFGGIADLMSGFAKSQNSYFVSPFQGIAKQFGYHIPEFGDKDKKAALLPAGVAAPGIASSSSISTQNNLSIDINDPFGLFKSMKQTGPAVIPIKVTSTTGNK